MLNIILWDRKISKDNITKTKKNNKLRNNDICFGWIAAKGITRDVKRDRSGFLDEVVGKFRIERVTIREILGIAFDIINDNRNKAMNMVWSRTAGDEQ